MADPSSSAGAASQAPNAAPSNPKPQNPAMRMMGMPNFRFRLPSRNWMIFWTITGSFTAALIYDRREKKRAQAKWCDLVAHLSKESLPIDQTRRKLTVFLSAPPGDGLRIARDHFKEYVKPILVAAALDYQVVEGRREGDVRAGLAERIRKVRREAGEHSSVVQETGVEDVVADARKAIGVTEEPGPKGDLVIGRHTWKEYIRGLHEGWLGPLDPPQPPAPELTPDDSPPANPNPDPEDSTPPSTDEQSPSPTTTQDGEQKPEDSEKKDDHKKEDEKPKPTGPTPAYIAPADYASQQLPPSLPQSFDGSVPVPFPHILGFLNTPIRIYRYLNQRYLADEVGRDVAGMVLASYTRPYVNAAGNPVTSSDAFVDSETGTSGTDEQATVLEDEEREWHKSVHKSDPANPDKEREWLNDVVLDPRLASRMKRFVLSAEEEARAQRIASGEEYVLGEERPPHVSVWQHLWIKYGYGEDEATKARKPILGNLDGEDGQ